MSTLAPPPLSLSEGSDIDLAEIMAIMEETFDPDFGEAWTRSQCTGILAQNGVWLCLARSSDTPAGFALARMIADEAELLLIGVRPRFRGMAAGQALLEKVCFTAASLGAKKLHLEMREGNPAGRLYLRNGFEQVGRRKRYYSGRDGQKHDAITLALLLKRPKT